MFEETRSTVFDEKIRDFKATRKSCVKNRRTGAKSHVRSVNGNLSR